MIFLGMPFTGRRKINQDADTMTKRGRPSKEPTSADRAKVSELLANDAPLSDIAKMLGYSLPTFRKHFRAIIFAVKKTKTAEQPQRTVTADQRAKVKRYVGCKMPLRKIAFVLGYDTDDDFDAFRTDFAREIEIGDAVYRAKVLDRLDEQMSAGMIGATNKLESLTQIADDADGQAASPGYVGKKTAAKADAAAMIGDGSKFAPRGTPRLAAVNGKSVGDRD
jgi:hypothetical protein